MYYNYRIESRAFEEPAAILFTSAKRKKKGIPPPPVRLSWDSPHPPPESVRMDERTLTSGPKFFGSTGYQILLPIVLRELRYNEDCYIINHIFQSTNSKMYEKEPRYNEPP